MLSWLLYSTGIQSRVHVCFVILSLYTTDRVGREA